MNKTILGIGAVVIILLVGAAVFFKGKAPAMPAQTNSAVTSGSNAVSIQNFSFAPAALTVKVGDTVTWTNNDSAAHSATADDKSFDTGLISPGQSGKATFSKAGTYSYYCSVHPGMKGTVVVQ